MKKSILFLLVVLTLFQLAVHSLAEENFQDNDIARNSIDEDHDVAANEEDRAIGELKRDPKHKKDSEEKSAARKSPNRSKVAKVGREKKQQPGQKVAGPSKKANKGPKPQHQNAKGHKNDPKKKHIKEARHMMKKKNGLKGGALDGLCSVLGPIIQILAQLLKGSPAFDILNSIINCGDSSSSTNGTTAAASRTTAPATNGTTTLNSTTATTSTGPRILNVNEEVADNGTLESCYDRGYFGGGMILSASYGSDSCPRLNIAAKLRDRGFERNGAGGSIRVHPTLFNSSCPAGSNKLNISFLCRRDDMAPPFPSTTAMPPTTPQPNSNSTFNFQMSDGEVLSNCYSRGIYGETKVLSASYKGGLGCITFTDTVDKLRQSGFERNAPGTVRVDPALFGFCLFSSKNTLNVTYSCQVPDGTMPTYPPSPSTSQPNTVAFNNIAINDGDILLNCYARGYSGPGTIVSAKYGSDRCSGSEKDAVSALRNQGFEQNVFKAYTINNLQLGLIDIFCLLQVKTLTISFYCPLNNSVSSTSPVTSTSTTAMPVNSTSRLP